MRSLVFKEVLILSKAEKKARKVSFKPGLNLLTGENDVGKSTLIKALYHTLGANAPQLQNSRWKKARPIYCMHFALAGKEFYVLRDEKYFGVFDSEKKLLGRHTGISGANGIAHFINPLLKFNIELERKEDFKLGLAGPAYYFLPFYVDQDEGWATSWSSFDGLLQFRDYRKSMIEYHLGVRPQIYYDAKRRSVEFTDKLQKLGAEKATLVGVRDSYHKRKAARQVDLDPSVFRQEVEELVDRYNQVYGRQQQVLHELKEIRNERHGIENEILILRKAVRELDADYAFAEDPETTDPVGCPMCGTEIANSIVERFGILDDIDQCHALIDQRQKKLVDVEAEEKAVNEKYRKVTAELSPIDDLLRRQRENVTFAAFVSSEGIKDVMASLSEDIAALTAQEADAQTDLDRLADDLRVDSKRKKEITEFYQARMKEFLGYLNVHVLEAADYKSYAKQIKDNALGSDLPRSLLAQYVAFLHVMQKFSEFVLCPFVIDSPLQQEQDNTNENAIFDFIFKRTLTSQQLILGTVSLSGVSKDVIPENIHEIALDTKYGLLRADHYSDVSDQIGEMHRLTLATD